MKRGRILRWSYTVGGATAERIDFEPGPESHAPNSPRVRITTPESGITLEEAELLCATAQAALRIEREGKR